MASYAGVPDHAEHQTVALQTHGCRLNQFETEAIREQFVSRGFRVVPFDDVADVYVVNTCTVTNQADASARRSIRQAIRRRPEATVVATGCYAQTQSDELLKIEGVDLVLGNLEKGTLVDHVLRHQESAGPESHVTRRSKMDCFDGRLEVSSFENRTRAMLKVQDGCDQFCSFCIIPWARGRHRSLSSTTILRQARDLVENGYAEIVLTGVHLAEYGTDLDDSLPLTTVMSQILEQTDIPRLRLSSIWPTGVNQDLIDLMKEYAPGMCRYLHLAIQHAHDDVLSAMRRTYTVDQAEEVILQVAEEVPDISIGGDIMVGFPGETEDHFQCMYQWLESLPFAYFHVFTYSPRMHTKAARMPDPVPSKVSQERSRLLRQLSEEKSKAYHARFMGRVVRALVEEQAPNHGKTEMHSMIGRSDHGLKVRIEGSDRPVNSFADVEVLETNKDGVVARPCVHLVDTAVG